MKKKLQTTLSSKTKSAIPKASPLSTKLAKPPGKVMVKKETPVQIWFQFGIPQTPINTFTPNKLPLKPANQIKNDNIENKDISKSDTSGSSEEPTLCEDQEVFSKDFISEQVNLQLIC